MKKKFRFISALLYCIIFAASMSGCEKASERTIFITPQNSESEDFSAYSGGIKTIGSEKLLETMAFTMDGTEMNLDRNPYSEFKEKGWTFDPKLYGLEDLVAEIGNIYQRSIYLTKKDYDPEVFCIGITNFNQTPCGIEDIQIWSIEFTAHEKNNYPQIIMTGGVTWGSKKEDVIKAYGEPTSTERKDETDSTALQYTDNKGNNVYFEIYDNEGVGNIILESYKL